MSDKATDLQKLADAESQIAYYDSEIRHHDRQATNLRKVRQKYKAQRDRALLRLAKSQDIHK